MQHWAYLPELFNHMPQSVELGSFLSMVAVLRGEFAVDSALDQDGTLDSLSQLFSEMIEIQENEDWILLADLLEYEYLPLVRKTKDLVAGLREAMKTAAREKAHA